MDVDDGLYAVQVYDWSLCLLLKDNRGHILNETSDFLWAGLVLPGVAAFVADLKALIKHVPLVAIENAEVFGDETFGKAGSYNFVVLDDGSAIYMPTLGWYTPDGTKLGGEGVRPDLAVAFQREDEGYGGEAQFNRAYDFLNDQLPPFR